MRGIMQHIFNFEQCNTKDNVTYIMSKKFKKPLNKSCNPFQKTDLRSIITIVILVNILLFSLNIIGCKNVEKDPLTPQKREWLNKHDGKIIVNNEAGWPPIIDILEQITPAEKDTIYRKWISLGYLPFYKSKKFWIITISATGIIAVFILFILLWNKTLRSQVQIRTEKIESINTKPEQEINEKIRTETALLESDATSLGVDLTERKDC